MVTIWASALQQGPSVLTFAAAPAKRRGGIMLRRFSLWCLDAVSLTVRRSRCDDYIGGSPTSWGASLVAQDFKVGYPLGYVLERSTDFP